MPIAQSENWKSCELTLTEYSTREYGDHSAQVPDELRHLHHLRIHHRLGINTPESTRLIPPLLSRVQGADGWHS